MRECGIWTIGQWKRPEIGTDTHINGYLICDKNDSAEQWGKEVPFPQMAPGSLDKS